MADFLAKETVSDELLETPEKLCKIPSLKEFNIVGGTALALQIDHRKSVGIALFYNSIKDIAAMKIMAVATSSNRIKDYVDIYYLLKRFSLESLFNFYIEKYYAGNIQTALDNLPYFYYVSEDEYEALDFINAAQSLKEVCSFLSQEVKKYSENIMKT